MPAESSRLVNVNVNWSITLDGTQCDHRQADGEPKVISVAVSLFVAMLSFDARRIEKKNRPLFHTGSTASTDSCVSGYVGIAL